MIPAAKQLYLNRAHRVSTQRRLNTSLVCNSFLDSLLQLFPGKRSRDEILLIESELQELTSLTSYGARATDYQRSDIELKVKEVARYGVNSPATSKELNGVWEVLYTSSPDAPGSPLAGPSGVINCTKAPLEKIDAAGAYDSIAEFKSLGVLDGSIQKKGRVKAVSSDKYQLAISEVTSKAWLGQAVVELSEESYEVQILYLGEEIRVIEIISEAYSDEPCLVILKKRGVERSKLVNADFNSMSKSTNARPGLATISERQALRQMALEREKERGLKIGKEREERISNQQSRSIDDNVKPVKPDRVQRSSKSVAVVEGPGGGDGLRVARNMLAGLREALNVSSLQTEDTNEAQSLMDVPARRLARARTKSSAEVTSPMLKVALRDRLSTGATSAEVFDELTQATLAVAEAENTVQKAQEKLKMAQAKVLEASRNLRQPQQR
ncbi:hypothetical protein CEUSTIGMA_g3128.t1 [Chlamydomonas eustigma]|uniref:Plastid lipid-associated protein/fibrillin conserved domain-containing protein n=1 Tax=Chlamydomonas eustigma TaxID=1157962 RepID=A0A250WY24_9CHLO|nr:hypothetical protein CEUSTIGMA_g3128.t1 [Chlamydomonas eustigma]|eukprot:GAX75685.1 hypothetical protein CEUSTIGMA_g3128.t1 [Chlamydomonas eustigma]